MIATVPSATVLGANGHPVAVEVHVSAGLPGLTIVGLPDAACREARDRVRAALLSSGLPWSPRRITVNLAPSDMRKSGAGLDLSIAVGLLVASGYLPVTCLEGLAFVGELGLDGAVRPVEAIVPLVDAITQPTVVVPLDRVEEARVVGRHVVRGVGSLAELAEILLGRSQWPAVPPQPPGAALSPVPDMADVRGQPMARWAIEVAAAGGHNILLTGPPGAGKTMLASRLPGLLPPLDPVTALTCTRIHSAAGLLDRHSGLITRPPWRAPHHTASMVSMVGGGTVAMRPGEVSLAHGGALFLDELGEFPRSVLDVLRQPLEDGVVRISRARVSVTLPARFLLVGATNPCPCGEGPSLACTCIPQDRARHARRLTGPLLDRIDLQIIVHRPCVDQVFEKGKEEPSAPIAQRVLAVRQRAADRGVSCNAQLTMTQLEAVGPLSAKAEKLLRHEMSLHRLTARGLTRTWRVARTVADLRDGSVVITDDDVAAALHLRSALTPVQVAS